MPSHFIWYELLTTDVDASQRFYTAVVGWSVKPSHNAGMDYRHLTAPDGESVGGMLQLTDQMTAGGAHPVWLGYIDVPDVDAAVAAIEAQGGKTQMPAMTIETVGRMAMVADPQGAPFYVMTPTPPPERPDARSTAFSRTAVGHCGWNELATSDPKNAFAFYTGQFGWSDGGSMPMGEMGDYQFFNDESGMIGAVMSSTAGNRASLWTYYFRVADIDAAKTAVEANGGTVMHGPQDVPGGDYILLGGDPQGSMFALVGARKS
jgi:predicted enzyme related to lactoylglutathione lyase